MRARVVGPKCTCMKQHSVVKGAKQRGYIVPSGGQQTKRFGGGAETWKLSLGGNHDDKRHRYGAGTSIILYLPNLPGQGTRAVE